MSSTLVKFTDLAIGDKFTVMAGEIPYVKTSDCEYEMLGGSHSFLAVGGFEVCPIVVSNDEATIGGRGFGKTGTVYTHVTGRPLPINFNDLEIGDKFTVIGGEIIYVKSGPNDYRMNGVATKIQAMPNFWVEQIRANHEYAINIDVDTSKVQEAVDRLTKDLLEKETQMITAWASALLASGIELTELELVRETRGNSIVLYFQHKLRPIESAMAPGRWEKVLDPVQKRPPVKIYFNMIKAGQKFKFPIPDSKTFKKVNGECYIDEDHNLFRPDDNPEVIRVTE